jgi:hypothetical protein
MTIVKTDPTPNFASSSFALFEAARFMSMAYGHWNGDGTIGWEFKNAIERLTEAANLLGYKLVRVEPKEGRNETD